MSVPSSETLAGPSKVLLAAPRGYCAGVDRAVQTVEHALDLYGEPVYVRKEIVHNKHVVEELEKRGAIFVEEETEVPEGEMVVFSAHGVAPSVHANAEKRRLRTIDATCPLVTKVHLEAVKFAREGFHILLVGHAGHDEVVGTTGEAPDHITLVETVEDVANLPFPADAKLAYLTQTTLSVDEANVILTALKSRYPRIIGPNKEDICYATQNRQEAVRDIVPEADVVIVLGSQNSSNSKRLEEIARDRGRRAHLVDSAADLDPAWFRPTDTVLVTAGASAPEDHVQGVVAYLRDRFAAAVESRTVREEHVAFPLPRELRVVNAS
jgi:4-hydroxy-3-methylbut-2-en-1-yl diphosphate reductase